MEIKIGTTFFIDKNEYEARGSDEKFERLTVTAETGREWRCLKGEWIYGVINKRSGKFHKDGCKTQPFYTKHQKELIEFAMRNRYHIMEAVRYAEPALLGDVADVLGYKEDRDERKQRSDD